MNSQVILVDEADKEIGLAEKVAAHVGAGKLHRAFSVFLFNEKREMLIQQRSAQKMLWPKFWSNAVCSHPRPGESILSAAQRRIPEEIGLRSDDLKELYAFIYQARFSSIGSEHEYCHVLLGQASGKLWENPDEVSAIKWAKPEEILSGMEKNPEAYTPWFKMEMAELKKRGIF